MPNVPNRMTSAQANPQQHARSSYDDTVTFSIHRDRNTELADNPNDKKPSDGSDQQVEGSGTRNSVVENVVGHPHHSNERQDHRDCKSEHRRSRLSPDKMQGAWHRLASLTCHRLVGLRGWRRAGAVLLGNCISPGSIRCPKIQPHRRPAEAGQAGGTSIVTMEPGSTPALTYQRQRDDILKCAKTLGEQIKQYLAQACVDPQPANQGVSTTPALPRAP
jgi:hypothetical protein